MPPGVMLPRLHPPHPDGSTSPNARAWRTTPGVMDPAPTIAATAVIARDGGS